jgi:hypothetical protein
MRNKNPFIIFTTLTIELLRAYLAPPLYPVLRPWMGCYFDLFKPLASDQSPLTYIAFHDTFIS